MKRSFFLSLFILLLSTAAFAQSGSASASVKVSISVDVSVKAKTKAELADKLYASGDFSGALKAYEEGFVTFKDAAFLYAQAQCYLALDKAVEAKLLFEQYLALGAKVTLTFKAEAEAGLTTIKAKLAAGVNAGLDAGAKIAGLLKPSAKFSASADVALLLKPEVKIADEFYALGKYDAALKAYAAVYLKSPEPILLYAQAQCHIALDNRYEAISLLRGALAAGIPKYKVDAEAALRTLNVSASNISVAISVAVSAAISAEVKLADQLYASAKYGEALKAYISIYAKAPEASLLYAQGQCYRMMGAIPEARVAFQGYLKATGTLKFKADAEAALTEIGGEIPKIAAVVTTGVKTAVDVVTPPAPKLPKVRPYRVPGLALGALGVVGIGGFSFVGLRAAINPDIDFNLKIGLSFGISGVALGGVAAILLSVTATAAVDASISAEAPRLQLSPMLAPNTAGVSAGFKF